MEKQCSRIDIWSSKDLVQYYMSDRFKEDFSKTRVIIDGTEIYIERSGDPLIQQSSFSVHKNHATLKGAVGSTSGGLISYRSSLHEGSTSDRQLVERCNFNLRLDLVI
ncbi:hypothetical protein QAD02_007512 [Eretmocerus hayati]|uniref:Uncharacterized protein n=1 Tax=Eretmocerus hayati TaxID=131215 RepID=A0ACC2N871_9HYME|nr:hypothetical protein QAD02_007512 [Eretmocerus hayati]